MASSIVSDAPSAFSYTPLANPGSQIRLLTIPLDIKLFLGRSSPSPLTGNLATYNIPIGTMSPARRLLRASRLPLFYALSYVWGDPTRSHEIWIDGKRLTITRNLYLALRAVQSGITGTISVWADAICINQEDNSEKSAQIQLMREIYQCASDVRIWLGLGTPETSRCLGFVNDLTENQTRVYDEPTGTEDDVALPVLARALLPPLTTFIRGGIRFGQGLIDFGDLFEPPSARDDETEITDPDGELSLHQGSIHKLREWKPLDSRLKAVEEREGDFIEVAKLIDKLFIQQTWFTRMWVVQEVCCARSCEIQVGRTTLGWDPFIQVIHYLHFHRKVYLDNVRRVIGLEIIRLGWKDRKRQSLQDLIRETRYREATDPKDKIYSLYGLMGDRMNEYLKPNYSLSVAEVYSNTSRHFVIQTKKLDCLLGWQNSPEPHETGVSDLPSWVPDYSLPQTHTPSPLVPNDRRESIYAACGYDHRAEYTLPLDTKQSPLSSLPSLSESPILPHTISALTDWTTLKVRGIHIDTIISISALPTAPNLSLEAESDIELAEKSWISALLETATLQQELTHEIRAMLGYISDLVSFYSIHSQQHSYPPEGNLHATSGRTSTPPPFQSRQILKLDKPEYLSLLFEHLDKPEENSLPVVYLQALLSGRISSRERTTADVLRQFITTPYMSYALQPETPEFLDTMEFIQKSAQALASSLLYRRLAITQNGHLAAVPASTQIGDVAAVLFGASVVCILRWQESALTSGHSTSSPKEERLEKWPASIGTENGEEEAKSTEDMNEEVYTMVGEAYLHGFMDAEAIALCVRGKFDEGNYVLR